MYQVKIRLMARPWTKRSPQSDSDALAPHFEVPKGFYLRTVNGQRWQRRYRCDLNVVLPPPMTSVSARRTALTTSPRIGVDPESKKYEMDGVMGCPDLSRD